MLIAHNHLEQKLYGANFIIVSVINIIVNYN
jgi:hypothetical protein